MKLYATTTSERASKGQGGNKEIVVSFMVGGRDDSREVAQVILTAEPKGGYTLSLFDSEEEGTPKVWKQEKGEKQKGECTAVAWSKECKGCEFCKRTLEQD